MGCDIHFFVEQKAGDGTWQTADKWGKDKYDDRDRLVVDYDCRFYNDRNYYLFAILAGVRNGYGDSFNTIAAPRGLPADACQLVKAEGKEWEGDAHNHSFFTVAELLAFDWAQKNKWGDTYKECCETFWSETMPRLLEIGPSDDVRVVFWFDN